MKRLHVMDFFIYFYLNSIWLVKQNTFVGSEKKLLDKCNVADKMIQDTEKKLKNSIKMATEFKNKIESQKSEVLISLILNELSNPFIRCSKSQKITAICRKKIIILKSNCRKVWTLLMSLIKFSLLKSKNMKKL